MGIEDLTIGQWPMTASMVITKEEFMMSGFFDLKPSRWIIVRRKRSIKRIKRIINQNRK